MTNTSPQYQGKLLFNESMKKHTSWRVGGNAEKVFKPANRQDLQSYMRDHEGEQFTFIGLGSNVLIRDGGLKGTVIVLTNALDEFVITGNTVYAEAGLPCAKLARKVAKAGLVGAEFFAGIPGTVGGALAMNAGAWGAETWPTVTRAEYIDSLGNVMHVNADAVEYGYRSVQGFENTWFLSAIFSFESGDVKASEQRIKELLRERAETQPTGVPSCGSVFRNPERNFAAKLIESCGLKGKKIGGAIVSEKHANFIINDGDATAKDIEELIHFVQDEVKNNTGYELIKEVKIIGEQL